MCSSKHDRQSCTVVARLTLWYAVICALFCGAMLTVVSMKMSRNAAKRIDHYLTAELCEFASIYTEKGIEALQEEFGRETESEGANKLFCRLVIPGGAPIATSKTSEWDHLEEELQNAPLPDSNKPVFCTLYPEHSPLNSRMASVKTPDNMILQLGINLHAENHYNRKIQKILIISSLLMLALSTFSGWLIARRAMAGIHQVTQAVSKIHRDSLDQQVSFANKGREIDELVAAFNSMLLRIKSLVRELKEVSDNVAHDLRSPITRMRGIAETTLTAPCELSDYQEMGLTIIEECDRLTEMINTTLEIAQAESGLLDIDHTPLDLVPLLHNAIDLFLPVAEEKQIVLNANVPNDPLVIFGDKGRLQRVTANLIDNAIKYTPVGGRISVNASKHKEGINIEISDSGPGIPREELDRIFERFYRGEKSRSSSGNGLGLSLARTVVQAHGGTVTAQNNPDGGCTFSIHLPIGTA